MFDSVTESSTNKKPAPSPPHPVIDVCSEIRSVLAKLGVLLTYTDGTTFVILAKCTPLLKPRFHNISQKSLCVEFISKPLPEAVGEAASVPPFTISFPQMSQTIEIPAPALLSLNTSKYVVTRSDPSTVEYYAILRIPFASEAEKNFEVSFVFDDVEAA